MALRLSTAFKTTPEMWLDMQQKYDLWQAEKNVKLTNIKQLAVRAEPLPATTTVRATNKLMGTPKGKGIVVNKFTAAQKVAAKNNVTKR